MNATPDVGQTFSVTLTDAPATVLRVIGFNPAYRAWVVRADWKGRTHQMLIDWSDTLGWIYTARNHYNVG